MNKRSKFILWILFATFLTVVCVFLVYLYSNKIAVLDPKGIIGLKQRNLMLISTLLMLIVVIPVFIMTIVFSWKYRASNQQAEYDPNWDNSWLAEAVWWGVPCIIIAILSYITWTSSHELDPLKPLESNKKPLTVQVVALQWKWLFIYPEQQIATVNFFHIPAQTPINFEITADAPMNSFWIPQLGGQIYAMPGMKTLLHLIADEPGHFRGSSANISGTGFANMAFNVEAMPEDAFNQWVESVKKSNNQLNHDEYQELVKPSTSHALTSFILQDRDLFNQILMEYMAHTPSK